MHRFIVGIAFLGAIAAAARAAAPRDNPAKLWLGVHVSVGNHDGLEKLRQSIPGLAKTGVNALIVEIDYNFQFASHPELNRPNTVTREQARSFADLCRANGIRPIPSLNCLGHQSWAARTAPLLATHPELDETPGKYPSNEGIYCRSWCPLNPDTNRIVFGLIDELIDAFAADAFHVGMDEVFILASDDCPRCRGKDPARLFARQVNDLHEHLVKKRKVEMLMWGDRLLDTKAMGYSKWEASENGTAAAADLIAHDIIICDWHYERRASYPSIPFLLNKGFRVWPAGWHDPEASEALLDYSTAQKDQRILGYLSTTWGKVSLDRLDKFEPTQLAAAKLGLGAALRSIQPTTKPAGQPAIHPG